LVAWHDPLRSMILRASILSHRQLHYLIRNRAMSSSAFIVPFDPQTPTQVVPNVNSSELWSITPPGDKIAKVGTTRIFFNTPASKVTALSSLGEGFAAKQGSVKRELVRKSVGSAVKEVKGLEGVKEVSVDASADPHAAGDIQTLCETEDDHDLFLFMNSCRRPFGSVQIFFEDLSSVCIQSKPQGSHPCETDLHATGKFQSLGPRCCLC
jgi:hypothetical protein